MQGRFIGSRRLKERGVYSHIYSKNLNKTNVLSTKISRKFKNNGISTPSSDTPGPSRDLYRSLKSQHSCQNPHSLSLAVFTLKTDTDNPSSKSVKIDGKTDG